MRILQMGSYDPGFVLTESELRTSTRIGRELVGLRVRSDEEGMLGAQLWGDERTLAPLEADPAPIARLLGLFDQPEAFNPDHPALRRLVQRFAGMHLPRVPLVFDRLVQVILQQLVSYREAVATYRRFVHRHGETIPGLDLLAPPDASRVATLGADELIAVGVLPRQARTIIQVARRADELELAASPGGASSDAVSAWLERVPGVGRWTIGFLLGSGLGEPDAVLLGDYNLPQTIALVLDERGRDSRIARRPAELAAADARMLELLAPFRGHRFRVIRLALLSGVRAPRRGPRHPSRPSGW